jgi:ClpP class serine protease
LVILGACDTEAILGAIDEAAGREDVQAIFLDIDSPGRSVNGTPELARASKEKYVYDFAAGQADAICQKQKQ